MRLIIAFTVWLAILCSGGNTLLAANLWNTPVYNPASKSYFELYTPVADKDFVDRFGDIGLNWTGAKFMAEKLTFKGVRGRLAVVRTREDHEFLKSTFHPTVAVWIGLRYWCKFKKLQWVTGEIFDAKKDFSAWGPMWNQGSIANYAADRTKEPYAADCPDMFNGGFNYLGVHYWGMSGGFQWNANGYAKQFSALFVEFPTGKP